MTDSACRCRSRSKSHAVVPSNASTATTIFPWVTMDARRRELSKEEHFRVLDQLVEMGCFWILYTGGEIFARKDFLEIYTYAKKKGFLITLFTNGTIMTEEIADYLAEWPPFAIEITLYGRTRETYEALTVIPGSYDRCLRGIKLLKERGLPLKLKTVATSINKHEVLAMRRVCRRMNWAWNSRWMPRSIRESIARRARWRSAFARRSCCPRYEHSKGRK